ncbi:UNVERIFIED_CONTAM: hypothetical protein PYX00_009554 [Menopon gallinae]|uniref:Secreted protein n=1 Tax=Menopon gallinae TaxID=328185 RepID=A0AAW2HBV2_9NEOP
MCLLISSFSYVFLLGRTAPGRWVWQEHLIYALHFGIPAEQCGLQPSHALQNHCAFQWKGFLSRIDRKTTSLNPNRDRSDFGSILRGIR